MSTGPARQAGKSGLVSRLRSRRAQLREDWHLSRQIDGPIVMKMLDLQETDRVLDLCCGGGLLTRRISPRVAQVAGLDIDPQGIAGARSRLNKPGARPNAVLVVGNAARLPFPDGAFDKVLCNCSLQHIPTDGTVVSEVSRVLRPGGVFVVTVPRVRAFERSRVLAGMLGAPPAVKRLFLARTMLYSDMDLRHEKDIARIVEKLQADLDLCKVYSPEEMAALLSHARLQVEEMRSYEKYFGRAAQEWRYAFSLGRSLAAFPFQCLLAGLDRFLPESMQGDCIAVKARKS